MSKLLVEDRRNALMAQGRRGEKEKGTGKSRYEMRVNSKVASTVKEFNEIDMESLFVHNILTINVPVRGETNNYLVRIKFGGFLDIGIRDTMKDLFVNFIGAVVFSILGLLYIKLPLI